VRRFTRVLRGPPTPLRLGGLVALAIGPLSASVAAVPHGGSRTRKGLGTDLADALMVPLGLLPRTPRGSAAMRAAIALTGTTERERDTALATRAGHCSGQRSEVRKRSDQFSHGCSPDFLGCEGDSPVVPVSKWSCLLQHDSLQGS
jgi:hypothetical protein